MNPAIDLISARPWQRTMFTTFSLSLSFYEVVVLDALIRGGSRESMILSDIAGVRAALMELGARRAGREYQLEPVAVSHGVFHPKISVFVGDDDCHLMVGSGNLTFGGWGGNLEICEHIHPSFASDAFLDASEFFEYLTLKENQHVRHGAQDYCGRIAEDLRSATRGRANSSNIRLFHNLDGSISEKIAQATTDLGGALQLFVSAPYWDSGVAIDRLCQMIGLTEVFIHSHPNGTVESGTTDNWPRQCKSKVHAVTLNELLVEAPTGPQRRLHAKLFEIICKRGRIVLSGSANGTIAALGFNRNIEACIARIQREKSVGWRLSPASPPSKISADADPTEEDKQLVGILRAELKVDRVTGRILHPPMPGLASVFQVKSGTNIYLNTTDIGADGEFAFHAPQLDTEAWKGGRLVLKLESELGRAEGFVSVASFREITRRAGALAPKLMAIIAGTETPADVAAIFSWFNEDPRRLLNAANQINAGISAASIADAENNMIPVDQLDPSFGVHPTGGTSSASESRGWQRFMEQVFAAFRERRGQFPRSPSGDLADDDADEPDRNQPEPTGDSDGQSLQIFEKLFETMLKTKDPLQLYAAYELMRYVSDRLKPDNAKIKRWLNSVIDAICQTGQPIDQRNEIAAGVLTLLGSAPIDEPALRRARAKIFKLGIKMSERLPFECDEFRFADLLMPDATYASIWSKLLKTRTFAEQSNAYLLALRQNKIEDNFDFEKVVPKEWEILQQALTSEAARKNILQVRVGVTACPRCYKVLPKGELHKLQMYHVATASNCCGRVMICGD